MLKIDDIKKNQYILVQGSEYVLRWGDLDKNDIAKIKKEIEQNRKVCLAKKSVLSIDKDDFLDTIIERIAYNLEEETYSDFEDMLRENLMGNEKFLKATDSYLKKIEKLFPEVYSEVEEICL